MIPSSLVVAGAVALLFALIQRRLRSPLRSIPGPLLASVSSLWLTVHELAGIRTSYIHKLHLKYGPVVRVGPNEISFSDSSVVNQIYTQQTIFLKAPHYETMSVKPLGIFSLRDKAAHSQRRSLLSHAFSQQSIDNCSPLIDASIANLVDLIGKHLDEPFDVWMRFRFLALDIVGELFLGRSFGALENDHVPRFLEDADTHFLLSGIETHLSLVYRILCAVPLPALRNWLGARERIAQFGRKAFEEYVASHGRASKRQDLLTKILSPPKDGFEPLSDRDTYVEIGNLCFAGEGTTSASLAYLFWELTRHPEWQNRIREEASNNKGEKTTFQRQTPILDAVINEALRLHPSAPASLLRVVPAGGAELADHMLPSGTIVSMQSYTTQRDKAAFPNPDSFLPDRWLSFDPSPEQKLLFMPFSRGTRACLGKGLALLELKRITTALISRYSVSAPPWTNEDSMEMRDHFLAMPKAGKCELVFSAV